jgi:signal transduction histidine kinase
MPESIEPTPPDVQQLRDELSRLIKEGAERERRHADVVAELQRAVTARDDFIAIAAHELRNPMTPILGLAEHLLIAARRPDRGCAAPVASGLERLGRSVEEFITRATTIMDVSRITSGTYRAELSATDLSALVREAAQRYEVLAEKAGCRLDVSIEDGVAGTLDQLAVGQITDNLLSNAIKYGAGAPIEISLVRDGATARLTVTDHGIGIPAADQARLFERFERAVTRRQTGGFGIGLWLSRQLATAMRGEISVSSVPGEGSTFTLLLPL